MTLPQTSLSLSWLEFSSIVRYFLCFRHLLWSIREDAVEASPLWLREAKQTCTQRDRAPGADIRNHSSADHWCGQYIFFSRSSVKLFSRNESSYFKPLATSVCFISCKEMIYIARNQYFLWFPRASIKSISTPMSVLK